MEAIYQQNGDITYLSSTDFDTAISPKISMFVAHKIGDAYDYRHDVAIVYANEPFILSTSQIMLRTTIFQISLTTLQYFKIVMSYV